MKLRYLFLLVALLLIVPAAHAQQGPPEARLNWNAPTVPTTSALSYVVERATASTGPWNVLTTISAVPPATVSVNFT